MATNIKERAKNLHDWILRRDGRLKYCKLESLLERELAEQDAISRQDERERCINAAQELVCKKCFENSAIGCRYANDVAKCELLIELRKAIEEGGAS